MHFEYLAPRKGEVTTVAGDGTEGSDDGPAAEASFSYPAGIALHYHATDGERVNLSEGKRDCRPSLSPFGKSNPYSVTKDRRAASYQSGVLQEARFSSKQLGSRLFFLSPPSRLTLSPDFTSQRKKNNKNFQWVRRAFLQLLPCACLLRPSALRRRHEQPPREKNFGRRGPGCGHGYLPRRKVLLLNFPVHSLPCTVFKVESTLMKIVNGRARLQLDGGRGGVREGCLATACQQWGQRIDGGSDNFFDTARSSGRCCSIIWVVRNSATPLRDTNSPCNKKNLR